MYLRKIGLPLFSNLLRGNLRAVWPTYRVASSNTRRWGSHAAGEIENMKKQLVLGIAFLLSLLIPAAGANEIVISFDELETGERVLEFYNGGNGSDGTGPGPDMDVSFSSGWTAGSPDVYWNAAGGNSAEISGQSLVNMHTGWSGMTSFYYSGEALEVSFYDAENGLGNRVGTWDLPAQAAFSATGEYVPLFFSAVFTSSGVNRIDALTNGSAVIPEPTSLLLLSSGLGAIALAARRKQK
jgi:hypothetical protein